MKKTNEIIPIVEGPMIAPPNMGFNPLQVKVNSDGNKVVDYFIHDGDGEFSPDCVTYPSFYTNFIAVLDDLKPLDVVNVHLNTLGGNLQGGLMIYEALMNTLAKVVVYLEGPVASAGSMIMMAGDDFKISRFSYVMIHTFSGGFGGKANDVKKQTEFTMDWWNDVFNEVYKDFLTEEEIHECIENGREYWFKSEEVEERLNKAKQKYVDRDRLVSYIQMETQSKINKDMQDFIDEDGTLTEKGYKKLASFDKKFQVGEDNA